MSTPRANLPEIAQNQASKYLTHNKSLWELEALTIGGVIDRDLTSPPSSPNEGDLYIPASTATGAWQGKEDNLAYYVNGEWIFSQPQEGWQHYLIDEAEVITYSGSGWELNTTTAYRLYDGTDEVTASQARTHIDSTSNPHSVTATQVNNTTAQWNADQLQGNAIATTSPTDGQGLFWDVSAGEYQPQTPSNGDMLKSTYDSDENGQIDATATNTPYLTFSLQSTDYTLQSSDHGKWLEFDSSVTVTLPDGLTNGFQCFIQLISADTVTLSATTNLNAKGTQITTQWGVARVTHRGSNEWRAEGDLS